MAEIVNYCKDIEDYAMKQAEQLASQPMFKNAYIALMPDCHPGKVAPIGFTASCYDENYIIPAVIGNDIGCGVLCIQINCKPKTMNWEKIDTIIRDRCINAVKRKYEYDPILESTLNNLRCKDHIDLDRCREAFCTLGGGNHFIEVDADARDIYLTIHTGSRHLGQSIYNYYTKLAKENCPDLPIELAYLTRVQANDYFADVNLACEYAMTNRYNIAKTIIKNMGWKEGSIHEDRIHNDISLYVCRKGAISAVFNEDIRKLAVIPINSRDGIILAQPIEDKSWNYSLPHGAGRLMARSDVKDNFTVNQYKKAMEGVYSSTISSKTLDEAPMVYRDIESIKSALEGKINIITICRPVYSFKNGR